MVHGYIRRSLLCIRPKIDTSLAVQLHHSYIYIAGKNYRSVLDANGDYNNNQTVTSWQYTCESITESIRTLRELIDVMDGYSGCIGFTSDEIDEFILALCTG